MFTRSQSFRDRIHGAIWPRWKKTWSGSWCNPSKLKSDFSIRQSREEECWIFGVLASSPTCRRPLAVLSSHISTFPTID
jgi:hypothetical protein